MDKKYNTFHDDFSQASKKAKELDQKISNSFNIIKTLKEKMKEKKETAYLRRYRASEIETLLSSIYHDEQNAASTKEKLQKLYE